MYTEFDWDIYETLAEQIQGQLPSLERDILSLDKEDQFQNALDDLFRYFHSYKATSAYLKLDQMTKLVTKVEIVLSSLRESRKIVQESLIHWLLAIKEQMHTYSDEMDLRQTNLSVAPEHLLQSIKVTSSYTKPIEKLKSLSILYMDNKKERANKVLPHLRKYSKNVTYSTESDSENSVYNIQPYDILITNLGKKNHPIIKTYTKSLPIIAIFETIDPTCAKELLKNGISHSIENPLTIKNIERELLSIVRIYHSSKNIILTHQKIAKFIETLKPLPNTIFQIIQICDEEEMSINDLTKVVKSDPIISAKILKVANSPIYGSTQLKTIDQAVSRFGKQAVKALTMSSAYKSLGKIDLSAYNISEEEFSDISMKRLSLMLKWYAKVSVADLSVLSSSALLSNIGQLLLSKELIEMHQDDTFQDLSNEFTLKYAEESLLNTTTNQISSQILRFWKLSNDIIDVIEYTDSPTSAPKELQKLCVANHIVCSLIDLRGNIAEEIPDELLSLLADYDLDPAVLNKALESLSA